MAFTGRGYAADANASRGLTVNSTCSRVERASRCVRRVPAFVHREDGREISVTLTNVSTGGCELMVAEPLAVGELVRIEFPRIGGMAARIRWTTGSHAGAEFIPQSDVWEEAGAGPSMH